MNLYYLQFCICSVLYRFAIFVFIWYIIAVDYLDNITCFTKDYFDPLKEYYDYIIVGSGSAGSTVALRLSANLNTTVLVLEAGPKGGIFMDIPAIGPAMQLSSVDWQYQTIPQKHACKAMYNNISFWPSGKIIGGSGRLNNMIYLRGHKEDFLDWFKDNPDGYDYKRDVLDYFKKAEDSLGLELSETPTSPLREAILQSVKSLNYGITDDISINCFTKPKLTINNGKRWSTAHRLLSLNRPNLRIETNTFVEKILFLQNYEAQGVQFYKFKQKRLVKVRKGIILSAGVIGTPKILMQSGVGHKSHLNSLNIKNVIDLPVGDNLQDHVATGYDLIKLNKTSGFNLLSMFSFFSVFDYFFKSKGPWTSTATEVLGFIRTNSSKDLKPNLQLLVMPVGLSVDGGNHLLKISNIKRNVFDEYFKPLIGGNSITILPIVLHPKSRGTVRLSSKDMRSKPVINPNYLSHEYDVKVLIEGIRLIRKIIKTNVLKNEFGTKIYDEKFPGCKHLTFDSDEYWECYVRELTLTVFHPIGTCKMGKDKSSVVNYNLQMHHSNKLYIADSSVFPSLVSGNVYATVIMMAERLADTLLYLDYLLKGKCEYFEVFIAVTKCWL